MGAHAIILAAGEGTRMKSKRPKVTHELLGRPLVLWAIDSVRRAGIEDVACVVGHAREVVEPLVAPVATPVYQDRQIGTAHAVATCAPCFPEREGSLVVLSGDSPCVRPETIARLMRMREESGAAVVLLSALYEDPFGYGRIVRADDGAVERIVEQKDCTPDEALIREGNAGIYCFDASYVFDAIERISNDNAQGEFYLTDVIAIAREDGRAVLALTAEDASECLGVNNRVQLAQATRVMQRRINEGHMLAGVTMLDPDTVWIGPEVEIGPDTEILPDTLLEGACRIGSDCVIGPRTRLADTEVADGCVIDETIALEAVIGAGCTTGPRAYLRPGTVLLEGAKAGTHVEIKKSTVGKGSKVPHLSYVGDATIGAGVNLGAGTITCNYDGERKWPTTIGDGAFVGSDTMLVAPVEIGEGSLVAAGSVITDDVPAHSLAFGRARQVVKEGARRPRGGTEAAPASSSAE